MSRSLADLYRLMIMSFIVSVIILMDNRESLFAIEKRTTYVCGAIRKKCAVEPGNRVRTINQSIIARFCTCLCTILEDPLP